MDVLILCGSTSDLPVLQETKKVLESFSVSYELHVASAHRTPERVERLVAQAEAAGAKVIICAAGMAAHLAGAVAARTVLPVVGVPLASGTLGGFDSLLSTVQMPPGIPVATVAVGKPGAMNGAFLALEILALSDSAVREKLLEWRKKKAAEIEESG